MLREVIGLNEIPWLWLSHPDTDELAGFYPHWESSTTVLEAVPDSCLLMSEHCGCQPGVCRMAGDDGSSIPLNPVDSIHVGDPKLADVRQPLFDGRGVSGLYDEALFTVDSFEAFIAGLGLCSRRGHRVGIGDESQS